MEVGGPPPPHLLVNPTAALRPVTKSIYGLNFPDENFQLKHEGPAQDSA